MPVFVAYQVKEVILKTKEQQNMNHLSEKNSVLNAHQKFAVKNVDSIPKFIAFFAIRWHTIFAV